MNIRRPLLALGFLAATAAMPWEQAQAANVKYVISISVDGLGASYLQALIDKGQAPNFKRFQTEGAWTNNARNDYDNTVTLPNHADMLTGRGMKGPAGHNWTGDGEPAAGETLHGNKGSYLASVFDVAHDHGLRTSLFAGKKKFILYARSYDADHGAAARNGRAKIDAYVVHEDPAALTRSFVAAMNAKPFHYTFFHFAEPDLTGHKFGWGSPSYNKTLKKLDKCLGDIFHLVESNPALRGRTAILLTTDHGGKGHDHGTITEPLDYTIPFYVWGPDIGPRKDLYALNRRGAARSRRRPAFVRRARAADPQQRRRQPGVEAARAGRRAGLDHQRPARPGGAERRRRQAGQGGGSQWRTAEVGTPARRGRPHGGRRREPQHVGMGRLGHVISAPAQPAVSPCNPDFSGCSGPA